MSGGFTMMEVGGSVILPLSYNHKICDLCSMATVSISNQLLDAM